MLCQSRVSAAYADKLVADVSISFIRPRIDPRHLVENRQLDSARVGWVVLVDASWIAVRHTGLSLPTSLRQACPGGASDPSAIFKISDPPSRGLTGAVTILLASVAIHVSNQLYSRWDKPAGKLKKWVKAEHTGSLRDQRWSSSRHSASVVPDWTAGVARVMI